MTCQTRLRCILLSLCLSAFGVAIWFCSASWGEPTVQAAAPADAAVAGHGSAKYQGARECARCHTAPTADDVADGITRYFDLTECATWAKKDKHSLAYRVLKNARSRQMGQLLGIKPEKDASCLSCHAVNVDAGQAVEVTVLNVQEKGVSCEACHGPASNWVDDHWHPNKWRNKLTREQKTAKGLVDLRDVVTRAEVCLSCHVGNAQQGKVVTHEMFAAGHPPISGFEIETFARAMPPHWKPASDQPLEIRKQYSDQRDPDQVEAMSSTRMLIIGGLVALRNYAGLMGDNARLRLRLQADASAVKAAASASGATELAFYDCQACHHELTVDSWRQKRRLPGRPGRPAPRAWPIALGKLAAAACGEHRASLLDALQKFYQAIDKQPFGAPQDLVVAADQLRERAGETIRFVETERFNEAQGMGVLKAICASVARELPDFETARQFGWTALIVYRELPQDLHSKQIDEVLETMKAELSLVIPSREEEMPDKTGASLAEASEPDECVCVANKSVPQTLAAAARYDPLEFRNHCKALSAIFESGKKADLHP
jgi:hypothetical protein